ESPPQDAVSISVSTIAPAEGSGTWPSLSPNPSLVSTTGDGADVRTAPGVQQPISANGAGAQEIPPDVIFSVVGEGSTEGLLVTYEPTNVAVAAYGCAGRCWIR
ncbi:MAG: hypothetical protein AB7G88_11610, partial [Thermomicrobiales bacterium]